MPILGLAGFGGGIAGAGGPVITSSGGISFTAVANDGLTYRYHMWLSSTPSPLKTFVVGSSPLSADILIVGGGGGGGGYAGGGGGAGGVLQGTGITLTSSLVPQSVTIGTGGGAGTDYGQPPGGDGGSSLFVVNGTTCTAGGGKGGSSAEGNNARSNTGGSAGGGSRAGTTPAPGSLSPVPTPGGTLTGYAGNGGGGSSNSHPQYSGGAGGGSGGNGIAAYNANVGGTGGRSGSFPRFAAGYLPSDIPSAYKVQIGGGMYAAGGGGGKEDSSNGPFSTWGGAGGVGGAGMGGWYVTAGQNAFNFGCGGGGGGQAGGGAPGGSGADGIVMLRYPLGTAASSTGATATTSGATTPSSGLSPGNGYTYHTFTSPGSITFPQGGQIEVLLVAGGGGGVNTPNCCVGHGGGGGGGILHGVYTISPGPYPVTVGAGGPGANNGGNTTFNSYTALGGGYGGYYNGSFITATDGGSGGGAGYPNQGTGEVSNSGPTKGFVSSPTQTPSGSLIGYGSAGGYAPSRQPGGGLENMVGGGGGGAGEAGYAGTPGPNYTPVSGKGGDGRQFPAFTGSLIGVPSLAPQSGYYAGGGGAGVRNNYSGTRYAGSAGLGGGGAGSTSGNGSDGVANTGGGAGGGAGGSGTGSSTGGSGIVVIRYKV